MPSFNLFFLLLASVPPAAPVAPPLPPAAQVSAVQEPEPAAAEEALEEEEDADEDAPTDALNEIEELRALEGATLDPGARPDAEVLQSLHRLGVSNPLRLRMLDALEEPTFREDEENGELALITDLSTFDVSRVQAQYDIPVEMQPLVAQYIQFFQGPGRKWYRKWVGRSTRYLPMMQPILEAQGLPRDTVYLAMIESGFSPNAYSWAHAAGPWQFISSTGRQYGLHQDFWVDERRDPLKATVAAGRYLKDLHHELGHWYLAWAGYNTGSGRVRRLKERLGTADFWVIAAAEKGLAKETQHYVPKLIAAALVSKNPTAFGFSPEEFEYEQPLVYDEVKIPDATDLDVVARAAGVGVDDVQELNPELRRWCTPPASAKNPYTLRLPKGSGERFTENFAKLAPKERLTFRVHRVRRGDTLSQIAQHYGTAAEAILQMNRLKSVKTLKLNAELVVPVPVGRGGGKDEGGEGALARKVAQARRSGVTVLRPEDEVPAGTPRGPVATGPIKTETLNGRKRVTYGVQSGDSLWAIAQRFGVQAEDVRKWNNLSARTSRRALKVGSVLYVWPSDAAPKPVEVRAGTVVATRTPPQQQVGNTGRQGGSPGASQVHSLAAGESVWSVAQRYGVTVEELKRWNNIKDTQHLPTGLKLTVSAP